MNLPAMKVPAVAVDDRLSAMVGPQLSTDYLNRYGEALMLIEMAPADRTILGDLQTWRFIGYREHFQDSPLRCASSALLAYDRLASGRRKAFEKLCLAMARLIHTVTAVLAEMPGAADTAMVVDVASEALRSLIARATQFINANGDIDITTLDGGALQAQIDALLAG
ncbi:hypothetical protein [Bosea sp. PAMC 26642]|uniref:hypothetical protein n=1 Tax=Bosea sp. (strain PAMC 26642) TaxID=1792307 RepID=UPI00077043E8|nr:hypothetical protein [Bosea sp. PAMC 26642]AMJ59098.1 hypothetical protein AXW83_01190 [Bosea sp. PAMC 26642]